MVQAVSFSSLHRLLTVTKPANETKKNFLSAFAGCGLSIKMLTIIFGLSEIFGRSLAVTARNPITNILFAFSQLALAAGRAFSYFLFQFHFNQP